MNRMRASLHKLTATAMPTAFIGPQAAGITDNGSEHSTAPRRPHAGKA